MGINFVEKYENLSDIELASLSQGGDSDALAALLRRYTGLVRSRASVYFDGSVEKDELVQEGLFAIYSAVVNFNPEYASFSTFARLCVDRGIISTVRNFSRKRRIPQDRLVHLDDTLLISDGGNPEEILIASENAARIEKTVREHLSEKEHKVFLLFLQGYTRKEIASELSMSEKAVSNAVYRIKSKLKSL